MRNTANLAQVNDIVTAGVQHIANHDGLSRVKPNGALMAVTAPQFQQIMSEIDPMNNIDPTRINWENTGIAGMPRPTVKVTHKPANAANVQTTRSAVGSTGVKPSAGVTTTYVGDIYVEPVDGVELNLANDLVTVDVNDYYTRWMSGGISISQIIENAPAIGRIVRDLYKRSVKDLAPKLNDIVLQKLFLQVGRIPAYPSEATPSAGAPIKTVYGFQKGNTTQEGLKVVNTATVTVLRNMVDKAQSLGRPILIGGDIWKEWHDLKGISAINLAGIDFVKSYNTLPYDFYYDPQADVRFGSGVALLIEPNMVGFQTWNYADTDFIKSNTSFKNLHYATMNVTASQFKPSDLASLNMSPTSYSLRMDMRVKEELTSFDFPMSIWKPSTGGLFYYTPTGVLTTDSGDVFKDYTGVQAIKMEEYAPAV